MPFFACDSVGFIFGLQEFVRTHPLKHWTTMDYLSIFVNSDCDILQFNVGGP